MHQIAASYASDGVAVVHNATMQGASNGEGRRREGRREGSAKSSLTPFTLSPPAERERGGGRQKKEERKTDPGTRRRPFLARGRARSPCLEDAHRQTQGTDKGALTTTTRRRCEDSVFHLVFLFFFHSRSLIATRTHERRVDLIAYQSRKFGPWRTQTARDTGRHRRHQPPD